MATKLINDQFKLDRRNWIIASLAAATASSLSLSGWSASKDPVEPLLMDGIFRVKAVLNAAGEIRLKSQLGDSKGKNGKTIIAKSVPLKATATLEYDEQFETTTSLQGCRAYQYFHEANSETQIDQHATLTVLREQCHEILRMGSDQGVMTICPDNPLFAAERDLVECPINTMFLDQLLTDNVVNIADKWTIDNEIVCRLLNMDKVHDGKFTVCLVEADDDKAQLEIEGSVSASVRQVPTSIKIDGKAQLDRKQGCITWFAANIDETREIGEADPGFQVAAQIKILRSKIDAMSTGKTLSSIADRIQDTEVASMLQFQSDLGYYRFIANRKWSTYRDNGEEATLRYVLGNRVVAQCNVNNMVDYEPGRQLSLEGFKADVKNAIGNALTELVEGSERLSSTKMRLLRVVSRGAIQGVEIQWIHYHISNDDGRRVVLAFTLNEAHAEQFVQEDAQLADTFELINWPTKIDAKAVEAAAKAGDAADANKATIVQPAKKPSDQPAAVSSRPKISR